MKNIKLTIAYQGTHYSGWQIQPNGVTVQELLVKAVSKITKEKVTIHGSGRTDAGVHAQGQVANFYTESNVPPEKFALAINTKLPDDIRVLKSEAVFDDFHSRFSACGKKYCYRLYCDEIQNPFYAPYTWHIPFQLNVEEMRKAANYFIGTHDFEGFMSVGSNIKTTIRTIHQIEINEKGKLLELTFFGNGFLYNMVRILTGTLVAVGKNQIKADHIPEIILSKCRENAGNTAPAQGLMLMEVIY